MNVPQYRHQVQFPPKMAICCLPFHGLADSLDKGFREAGAGHRWHLRFYKVILLWWEWGSAAAATDHWYDADLIRSCYDVENTSSFIFISPIKHFNNSNIETLVGFLAQDAFDWEEVEFVLFRRSGDGSRHQGPNDPRCRVKSHGN